MSQWSLTLFKVSYCTLELDMLHGKGVAQKIFIDKEHIKEATHDSTSTSHVQIDSKILKSTCQNLLVVAVALLSESNCRRLLAIMVLTCSPHAPLAAACIESYEECLRKQKVAHWTVQWWFHAFGH